MGDGNSQVGMEARMWGMEARRLGWRLVDMKWGLWVELNVYVDIRLCVWVCVYMYVYMYMHPCVCINKTSPPNMIFSRSLTSTINNQLASNPCLNAAWHFSDELTLPR